MSRERKSRTSLLVSRLTSAQETKMKNLIEEMCKVTLGEENFGSATRNAEGRSGGILSLWNTNRVYVLSTWDMRGVFIVNRLLGKEKLIVNIYSSCLNVDKVVLWDSLHITIDQLLDPCVCVLGDFIAIKRAWKEWAKICLSMIGRLTISITL